MSTEVQRAPDIWHFWRGSPQMFAHVVATAFWWVEQHAGTPPTCLIDVEVGDDHELFRAPDTFVRDVTTEALRHFESIRAEVHRPNLEVTLVLAWQRPWWKPGPVNVMDADVTLNVRGTDTSAVEDVRQRMRAAVCRGRSSGRTEWTQGAVGLLGAAVLATVATATVLSALYLLDIADPEFIIGCFVFVPSLFAGIWWGTWLFPSLEIAPLRQGNLWRTLKTVGPIILAVLLAGVTKALYS